MGYIYGYSASGRMALACDKCGHVGGVRKRYCPVNYDPAWAMCAVCWATVQQDGTWKAKHAECPAAHDAYRTEQAAKDAHPEQWARSAYGDWKDGVPKGMVLVITRAGNEVMVPKAAYRPDVAGFGKWPGYTAEAQAYEMGGFKS